MFDSVSPLKCDNSGDSGMFCGNGGELMGIPILYIMDISIVHPVF
jgi:hypothetical protein